MYMYIIIFVLCSVWIMMVTRGYMLRVALLTVILMATSKTVRIRIKKLN